MSKMFGRLEQFDERSRQYPIRTVVEGKKPRAYTWRCNLSLDQGPDGACVGFAWTHELAARPAEVKNLGYGFAKGLYYEAQRRDHWEGGAYPGADPFYEGTSILAGAKVAQVAGYIGSYRWAFGLDDLILGVGYNGPAVIGVNFYERMMAPDSDGYVRPTGQVLGGHAMLVTAVNPRLEMFRIKNSWGSKWGYHGDCFITFKDMDKLLYEDGEACFAIKRTTKPRT